MGFDGDLKAFDGDLMGVTGEDFRGFFGGHHHLGV